MRAISSPTLKSLQSVTALYCQATFAFIGINPHDLYVVVVVV